MPYMHTVNSNLNLVFSFTHKISFFTFYLVGAPGKSTENQPTGNNQPSKYLEWI